MPEGPWTADLPSCLYRQGGLELRIAVLGTYDINEHSWMWGWANPGLRGSEVVALTGAVERYGRAHGIPEFTRETEAPGYLGLSAGPDTRVYFLPDDPRVPRAALDTVALPRELVTGASLIGRSARRVVTGYLEYHALPWREDGNRILTDLPGGGGAGIAFDAAGRISGVRLTMT
ncbi:hypothetical protein GCM10010343_35650 [Streptomyces avidinii]|uniref:Uncharacterized protein n=2 Tax=Streptomyces avidinii TaxID=1895 RepID=A0ABS4L7I1_STRAV|nr:DUF6882 domain-containing protein [Streptomyces avidinii]MBP2038075.1 hypothetical protein [Streptomyces avidinii]GGZ06570.1 hypothetical protein GCM10010343_35650 [Streptomyces avidinii]